MSRSITVAACLLSCAMLSACASSRVSDSYDSPVADTVPRPARIIVYDIAATADDIDATAQIAGYYDDWEISQTPEELALGRELGAMVSSRLADRLVGMGMTAQRAVDAPAPDFGDVVISGQLFSVIEGSRGKRVVIGFGAGSAELNVRVNGYVVTETGLQQLGARQVRTRGGRFPGVALPIARSSPVGLAANSAMKVRAERGPETLEAAATRAAERIAEDLRLVFADHGWL